MFLVLHTAVTSAPKYLASCTPAVSGRAVDEDLLPFPHIGWSHAHQGQDRSVADCRGLFEAHAGRHVGQRGTFPHTDELCVCPEPPRTGTEDVVTDRERADGGADCFDLSRQLGAEDRLLRSPEAREEAAEDRKSTRLNSSHGSISYAVFCLKKKKM